MVSSGLDSAFSFWRGQGFVSRGQTLNLQVQFAFSDDTILQASSFLDLQNALFLEVKYCYPVGTRCMAKDMEQKIHAHKNH